MNYCETKNENQPTYRTYRVEWCINIEDADRYRAGRYAHVYCKTNCVLLNPMFIGANCSLCVDTADGLIVLPYKQIVSMIPQKEKK